MAEEWVLAFPRKLLDELGAFQGIQLNPGSYLEQIFQTRNTRFVPRSQAETDPGF